MTKNRFVHPGELRKTRNYALPAQREGAPAHLRPPGPSLTGDRCGVSWNGSLATRDDRGYGGKRQRRPSNRAAKGRSTMRLRSMLLAVIALMVCASALAQPLAKVTLPQPQSDALIGDDVKFCVLFRNYPA